jgi:hypothetical protein
MTVLADVKMKHMVINLAAKCVHDTHKARAARLRNTIIQDDSSLSIWSKLAKKSELLYRYWYHVVLEIA